jgi:hypothetical protein
MMNFIKWLLSARTRRVQHVAREYIKRTKPATFTHGLHVLQDCGVLKLRSQQELDEACEMIIASGRYHPGFEWDILEADILEFMRFCRDNDDDLDGYSGAFFGKWGGRVVAVSEFNRSKYADIGELQQALVVQSRCFQIRLSLEAKLADERAILSRMVDRLKRTVS